MPSSSKNFNLEIETKNKCSKGENSPCISNLDSLIQSNSKKKSDVLNNDIRRYSEGSAQKNNVTGSRFTTTLVAEEQLRPTTADSKCNVPNTDPSAPLVTKAKNINVKAGFTITDRDG